MADLQFHDHIISDLLDPTSSGGALVIISAGLGLGKLVTSLLRRHSPSDGTLLLLTPPSPTLRSQIQFQALKLPEISAELPASARVSLYSSGGAVFVTARILIVDLLTSRIPAASIAGLVLLSAHTLAETSTEAFIVRILRSLNRSVRVLAFSDKPGAMVSGFAKAERTMKCLGIRKLHLWPRFHVYVSEELEREAPEVVDVRVQTSKHMAGIQAAIVEVMDGCLKEMRKTNKVDVEDLTVENGLFKSFDEIVRRQLDPIWHTLGRKTKQLVSDLKTLRKLLDYLVRYDAVTYLKYLDTLRVSESHRSVWVFAESSYKIFEYAKKRVYRFVKSDGSKFCSPGKTSTSKKRKLKAAASDDGETKVGGGSSVDTNFTIVLDEVLEEAPKWKVLREVLEEIEEERQKEDLPEDDSGIVLVACKDERSCMQLEECITNGPKQVMREEWEKYLLNKVQLRELQTRFKKKPKEPKGFGVLDGVTPVTTAKNAEPSSINKQEHNALVAAALEIRKRVQKEGVVEVDQEPHVSKQDGGRGKKNITIKNHGQEAAHTSIPHKENTKSKSTKLDESVLEDKGQASEAEPEATEEMCEDISANKRVLRRHSEVADDTGFRSSNKQIPPVQFYALESGQPVLDILKPTVIIVYHPDMTFVREIEVHKAENPSRKLKVYFLFYENSTEVQKFEASIRRENGAFESLIRQKSLMMIPLDQDLQSLGLNSSYEAEGTLSQNSVTRKAGGRRETEREKQVIVDMREFMSSLPNVLHQKGLKIIPVTLEVGDYILSPLICVERKSIQDLFMSFTSGRLYHQVEMMVRYYRIPVLLVEFSQDKSFSFQSASDIGDDVTLNNIISKLSLLALHFPRLRIIWSRSLHATAEIFDSLKANQDEPDEAKAMRVGVPSEEGFIDNDVRAENYNTSAVEFLRRLPGVTDSNYRAIMEGCKSLAELALLPLERLAELMGGQKAAHTLREFLDAKYPTLL